jgi:hypothetical protein
MEKANCLYQLFPPRSKPSIMERRGDCQTCIADERNRQCPSYSPLKTIVIERKEDGTICLS